MDGPYKRGARTVCALVISAFVSLSVPGMAEHRESAAEAEARLLSGDVVVGYSELGGTKYVTARVKIDHPPEAVWRVMSNPFEFKGKIFPRMKEVEVVVDRPELSVLRCSIDICTILPRINYTVESHYHECGKIDFRRVAGLPREFRGFWQVIPRDNGAACDVAYALFIDPGIPVPQWIVREGVKVELPRALTALRERVRAVCSMHQPLETRTILATATNVNWSEPAAARLPEPGGVHH